MSDAHAFFQLADDPTSVAKVLHDGIYAFYLHRGTVRPRKSPFDFLSSEQKENVAEYMNDYFRVGLEAARVDGLRVLKTALRRAAQGSTMLASLAPATLDRVIEELACTEVMILEVKSQRGPLVSATGLYAMVASIAQVPGGHAALDSWVAKNLIPAMKVIAYGPVIRESIIASVDDSVGQLAVSAEALEPMHLTPPPVIGIPEPSTRASRPRRLRKNAAKISGAPYPTSHPTQDGQSVSPLAGPMRTPKSHGHASLPRRPLQPKN